MQKISIKKKVLNDKSVYFVQALSLKNSENKTALLIPHPNGTEMLEFNSLEEAVAAVKKAGFEYVVPTGEIISEEKITDLIRTDKNDLENLLFSKFKLKSNDINSSVASSALKALSYLNDKDAVDIFMSKLGEDNDKIRETAIEGLVTFREYAIDKLINALSDTNWVTRNSAIQALTKISEFADIEPEKILVPIINRIDDKNTIVQSNALLSAGQIYRTMICRKEKR